MIERLEKRYTKYEVARILGARSLQLAMDAPILLKLTKQELDDLNFDSLKIAERELEADVLPITVRRPLPKKAEKTVKKLSEEEIREKLEKQAKEEQVGDKKTEGSEVESEEGEVKTEAHEENEIMEMAKPEDEIEDEISGSEEELM